MTSENEKRQAKGGVDPIVSVEEMLHTEEEIKRLLTETGRLYAEVLSGSKDKAILFAGDFEKEEVPYRMRLPVGDETKSTDYALLRVRLWEIFGKDVVGRPRTQQIKRAPEPVTGNLKAIAKLLPDLILDDQQSYINLGPFRKNKILLTIDRYINPGTIKYPLSEVWTVKRLKLNTDEPSLSGISVKPRSMVSTQTLPQE